MNTSNSRRNWLIVLGGLCLVLVALLWRRPQGGVETADEMSSSRAANVTAASTAAPAGKSTPGWRPASAPAQSAEQVVAEKLRQFARSRREIVRRLAARAQITIPPEVEQFFDAVEAGRWDETKALYETLLARRKQDAPARDLQKIWPALLETFGVAEAVQKWPADRLLDYGNSILSALRPGMVYIGGTDPGRFIPTLLNETSEGERHVVLTQNALADNTYLDYLQFLYSDRLNPLSQEDSQRAFQDYLGDAKARLLHDQQFPDEPKQVRPGEAIRIQDNRLQVSGQVAVMAINEKLVQTLMSKNPDASFAIEQSFPFKSMYDNTRLNGPVMELGAKDDSNPLNRDAAAKAVDYWRAAAQQIAGEPEESGPVRMAYGKMAAEQAALLLHHGYSSEAEQMLRVASELGPASPEAVFGYVNLLAGQNRFDEAIPVLERAVQADNKRRAEFGRLLDELNKKRQR